MANGGVVLDKKQRLLRSLIASQQGKENFMIMRTMGEICPQDVLIQTVLNDITIRYKSPTCHSNYLNPTESKTVTCASSGPSQNFCDQPRGKSRFEFVTTLKLVLPLAWQTQHRLSPKSANGNTCIGKNEERLQFSSSDHIIEWSQLHDQHWCKSGQFWSTGTQPGETGRIYCSRALAFFDPALRGTNSSSQRTAPWWVHYIQREAVNDTGNLSKLTNAQPRCIQDVIVNLQQPEKLVPTQPDEQIQTFFQPIQVE